MWPFSSTSYLAVCKTKQAERERLLAEVVPNASLESNEYLKASATEIVRKIKAGQWTASQVVDAYIARAAYSQSLTNSITEVLFKDAKEQAKALDKKFSETGDVVGPLHGVPISLKDQLDVKGYDSTIGFTQWAHKPADKDAPLVTMLKEAGGIPIVKTNVPQTMFSFESVNPLWGRTTNPYSKNHACGGSSGGEAALLAQDGSALGVGSDIGGSLRIPTAYCGIYSLKPGADRITNTGARGPSPGFEGFTAVLGPMGRNVEDLELFSRTILGAQDPTNHKVAPVPFREVQLPKTLKFGYYTSIGWTKSSPAVKRAVMETVEALRKQGHECVEFAPPDFAEAIRVFVGLTSADSYKTMTSHLGPDPMDPSLYLVVYGARLPGFLKGFASWAIRNVLGDKLFASVLDAVGAKPFHEYMKYIEARNDFHKKFYAEVWNKHNFDGIIAPVQAVPAIPHGACTELSSMAIETFYYNVIDAPVGCIPVTRVNPAKDALTSEWTTGPINGSSEMEKRIFRGPKPVYNAEEMKGLPVGVQIVGKKWEEEKVLGMMKVVDDALGPRGFGPGSYDQSVVANK